MRSVLVCVFLICALSTYAAEAVPDGEFSVKVTPSPQNKLKHTTQPYDDVLTIKGGEMTSKVSNGYGFQEGTCTLKNEGGRKLIVCEMKTTSTAPIFTRWKCAGNWRSVR
jgi:hypothetical protein